MKRLVPVNLPEPDSAAGALEAKPGVRGRQMLMALPPLSLYIHVPWCARKCPYCDFNSHALQGDLPEKEYLRALETDLEQALPDVWGRPISSVFFGGGTPSLLSAGAVEAIIGMCRAYLNLAPDVEVSLEANPGTAEAGRFKDYARAGINRLSIGVQSFNDEKLRRLGRIHDAAAAVRAIELAQENFARINLDLMFALPDQTMAQCEQDIRQALGFDPSHLSLYHLSMEPNTVFGKHPPPVPDDDLAAAMQDMLVQACAEHGLERYEVSAYAKPGERCWHNLNYWSFGDYLGIGPGAHSKISFQNRIIRQARAKMPQAWMRLALEGQGRHCVEQRELTHADLAFEFMLNALRLKDGVEGGLFIERTGMSLMAILPQIQAAVKKGLLQAGLERIQATELGWRHLNDLQLEFLD